MNIVQNTIFIDCFAIFLERSLKKWLASFSSKGSASDGRYKPDLTGIGSGVRASISDGNIQTYNCGTSSGSGTSYSSPQIAGMAALVRDYFAQGFYPGKSANTSNAMPHVSAALVKAMLINSSVHMSNANAYPPATDQGWGRVNLSTTLAFSNSTFNLYATEHPPIFDETPTPPYRTYLNILNTNQPVKITLVWSDYPATAGATKHLVNDIDLRVITPEQITYKGNVFSDFLSISGGDYDRTNNVEQVRFFPSTTGVVEISVWAHAIPMPGQDFALVATGDFEPHLMSLAEPALLHITRASNEIHISFPYTEAQRYILEFTDDDLASAPVFTNFFNFAEGVGFFTAGTPGETGTVLFADDFSPFTSGALPENGTRFYRVKSEAE